MPSTTIARFNYDEDSRVLSIWFVASGRRYDYSGVPVDVVEAFRHAFSKGRFFNEQIRDRYPAEWKAWEAETSREQTASNVIPFPSERRRR